MPQVDKQTCEAKNPNVKCKQKVLNGYMMWVPVYERIESKSSGGSARTRVAARKRSTSRPKRKAPSKPLKPKTRKPAKK